MVISTHGDHNSAQRGRGIAWFSVVIYLSIARMRFPPADSPESTIWDGGIWRVSIVYI